jgi:hypothetical protein
MFWIIVLVVVIVIVVFGAINSRKAKEQEKAEAAAAAEKRKEEQERLIKELESQAAAGDAVAAKKLTMIKEKINEPIVYDSTYSDYGSIYYRGAQHLDTIYSTAGNLLLKAIAEHGGWDDFSIAKETDNTKNPKEGNMDCYFSAVTGESCSVSWWYNVKRTVFSFSGETAVYTGYNSISASISLKMPAETVAAILEEFTRGITAFLKSNGAYQVCMNASQFYEPKTRKLTEIWNS